MALICMSLMISYVEHIFMYLLVIWTSLGKYLVRFFCLFAIGFYFLLLSSISTLYIFGIIPLLDIWFANIFSHSIGCFFIFLIVSHQIKKHLCYLYLEQSYLCVKISEHIFESWKSKVSFFLRNSILEEIKILAFVANFPASSFIDWKRWIPAF